VAAGAGSAVLKFGLRKTLFPANPFGLRRSIAVRAPATRSSVATRTTVLIASAARVVIGASAGAMVDAAASAPNRNTSRRSIVRSIVAPSRVPHRRCSVHVSDINSDAIMTASHYRATIAEK
jgi:hypothetical protein